MQITGKTKLIGVIGDPVEHSLSPLMHNSAIERMGLDYVYVPLPVKGENLEKALGGFEAIGLVGFNVTIPHKQAILPLLSEISPVARMVGAVNVVWRKQGQWIGANTDVEGFIAPLKTLRREWKRITPVILGNGGAARAVVVGCARLGCPEIIVVGRDRQKLERFEQSFKIDLKICTFSELAESISKTELLINTTPVGMYPDIDRSPVDESLMALLPPGAIAYDLIYNPKPTRFLKLAQNRGAIAIDGLEMLIGQGAAALEIWLGQPVPIEVMRQALL